MLVTGLVLAVYGATVCPTLGQGHDTGEVTAAALTMGVCHPPGYPLYVQLGQLFSNCLPFGEPAWRMNFFSSVCLALACGLLAYTVIRTTRLAVAGWVAGLSFAFATSPWRQAVSAEVFALHMLLLSSLAAMAVTWRDADDGRRVIWADLAALVVGLGLADQHILVLSVPGLLIYGALACGRGRRWGLTWRIWLLFGLGSLPFYLDMMWRARLGPGLNWGDPSNWERLSAHFLRRAYGTFHLSTVPGAEGAGEAHVTGYLFSVLHHQFPPPLFLLVGLGLALGWRRWRAEWSLLVAWALTYGPIFSLLGQQVTDAFHWDLLERFYASSYLALAGLGGLGAAELCLRMRPRGLVAAALIALPLVSLVVNLPKCSLAGQYQAEDTLRAMLDSCPPGSVVVVAGDLPAGGVDYLQLVQGYRSDLEVIFPGLVSTPWFASRLSFPLRAAIVRSGGRHKPALEAVARTARAQGRRVFFNHVLETPGIYRSRGLVWEWFESGPAAPTPDAEVEAQLQALRRMQHQTLRGDRRIRGDQPFWTRYLLAAWANGYRELAAGLFQTHPEEARQALDQVISMLPPRPVDYLNRGLLAFDLGQAQAARDDFLAALQLQPDYVLAMAALVDLARSQGRTREAQDWQTRLDQVRARPSPGG